MICGITLKDAVLNIGTTGVHKINGLVITHKYEEFYRVCGSAHKNKNKGVHNADDYFLSDFKNTLNQWYEEMGLNPEITPLNKVEFGVNIKLLFNPSKVLKCIILHKNNTGKWGDEKRNYKEFKYDNYSVKYYNKSELTNVEQYNSENILRFEVSIDKMKQLEGVMEYSKLSDLLDAELWKRFEKILIETIRDCLIIDFTDSEISLLSDKERIKYGDYINTDYWHRIYNETRKNRNKYKREREECDRFISQHSKSTLKTDIVNMVSVKCQELRDVYTANEIEKKWYELPTIQNGSELKDGTNYPVDKRVICTTTESIESDGLKHCKGCGRIISKPRSNQSFCSAKEVGYEQAHKCRNSNSNPRNNARTSFQGLVSIPLLFDLSEFIESEKLKFLVNNPINRKGITA